jgi:hypothetical protein
MADARLGTLIGIARRRRMVLTFVGSGLMFVVACALWWAGGKHGAHSGARLASLVLMALTGVLVGLTMTGNMRVHEHGIAVMWGDDRVLLFAELRAIRERQGIGKVEWIFVGPHGSMQHLDKSWIMSEAVRRRIEDERARLVAGGHT